MLAGVALLAVPVSALVASAEVQAVVALVLVSHLSTALVARIAAVLPVVVVLAGSSVVASGQPAVVLAHLLPKRLYHCPECKLTFNAIALSRLFAHILRRPCHLLPYWSNSAEINKYCAV